MCVCVPFVFSLNELLQVVQVLMENKSSHAWTVTPQVVGFIGDWISLSTAWDNIQEETCQSIGREAAVRAGEGIRCHLTLHSTHT